MTSPVAVIAHRKKRMDGDLGDLRTALFDAGVTEPLWFEVKKSKKAPRAVKRALDAEPELLIAWGGDGTVQRCVQEVAGTGVPLGVLPAGTANLLATSIGIPRDLAGALDVALHGDRRPFDVGRINGERFTVMAGTGFDVRMVIEADRGLKDRFGRLAYVWTGARAVRAGRNRTRVVVDGKPWFDGATSCLLVGNIGTIAGGLVVFDGARPDDALLDLGVVTARTTRQWVTVLARLLRGRVEGSRFVRTTRGRRIEVSLGEPAPYELDGTDRKAAGHLDIAVEPAAVVLCTPRAS